MDGTDTLQKNIDFKVLDLIGKVAAERLQEIIDEQRNGRIAFAMIGLGNEVTAAIALKLRHNSSIKIGIHRSMQVERRDLTLPEDILSDNPALAFRNMPSEGERAVVFSIPDNEVEVAIQSLEDVERLDRNWLLDPSKTHLWAREALKHATDETQGTFATMLKGLLASEVVTSEVMFAEFLIEVAQGMEGPRGLTWPNAVNEALPKLRLPKGMLEIKNSKAFAEEAKSHFSRARETAKQHLYLMGQNGEFHSVRELNQRLDEMELTDEAKEALRRLVNDKDITSGGWTESQAAVASLPWSEVLPFFVENKKPKKEKLGQETLRFFEDHFPHILNDAERELLSEINSDKVTPGASHERFFANYRERLKKNPKIYKRWERLFFNKPIEGDDLLAGLIQLAHAAYTQETSSKQDQEQQEKVLYVKLRDADTAPFWDTEKNTALSRYLRDRFRGLEKLFHPDVVLDFGRCWSHNWEAELRDGPVTKTGKAHTEFHFEAYLLPKHMLDNGKPSPKDLHGFGKAQMIWKPGGQSIARAFATDLRMILPAGEEEAFLLTGEVSQARHGRSGILQSVRLDQVETIIDVKLANQGVMADPDREAFRIDAKWPAALADHRQRGIISQAQHDELLKAFQNFRAAYTRAIQALLGGNGLADPSLVEQAELYGKLIDCLRRNAGTQVGIQDLWKPILRIGAIVVNGERRSLIIAAWHPLRLAEMAAKAQQAAGIIKRIVKGSDSTSVVIEDFVKDRVAGIEVTYYPDIGVIPDEKPSITVEVSRVADYSLLQAPFANDPSALANDPGKGAVRAFGRIASEYLDLRPHEKASFSVAILDAESEDLPVLMANHLSRQIEDQDDLRCDLVVTHEDQRKLRRIYELQNRRIGHELESAFTNETARTFLSRLRVGIVNSNAHVVGGDAKAHDIIVLNDVIARSASVEWEPVKSKLEFPSFATHVPPDYSRRQRASVGAVKTAVYLTSPLQPEAVQLYVDAIHDVCAGNPSDPDFHFLPLQSVTIQSGDVRQKLEKAHAIGRWVMTYDRIADRRVVMESGNLRVLRYYSSPRSIHNVIVSTEISRQYVGERLHHDLKELLPSSDSNTLQMIANEIHSKAASLSGGIVMRAAQGENSAKELLGVVAAQRQIDLLIQRLGEQRTTWFFLDEFKSWLDLDGEISDVLAVSLVHDGIRPRVLLTIVEAKFIGEASLTSERAKSMRQLESTYDALSNRFVEGTEKHDAVYAGVWRGRLADMLLEHMPAFNELGGIDPDAWLADIRAGRVNIDVTGHSIVFVHDRPNTDNGTPACNDLDKVKPERRRIAQWVFGRDAIVRTFKEYVSSDPKALMYIPNEWPALGDRAVGTHDAPVIDEGEEPEGEAIEINPSSDGSEEGEVMRSPSPQPEETVAEGDAQDEAIPSEETERSGAVPQDLTSPVPEGWLPEVWAAVSGMSRQVDLADGENWLNEQVKELRAAFHAENMNAPILGQRLTPNSALIFLDGKSVTVNWIEKNQELLLTKHALRIKRIVPMPGQICVALEREPRAILHLSDAWRRRALEKTAPSLNIVPVVAEKEEDGQLLYLPLADDFEKQKKAAPHTLIAGNTGSGKGILATNLILDLCAFNSPENLALYLIDPKQGVDYMWVESLPHFREDVIDDQAKAVTLLERLVVEMDDRYKRLKRAGVPNIDEYTRKGHNDMPRIIVFFDEVPTWMEDKEFRKAVESVINKLSNKSRAAGIHLVMIYQRADNEVMSMHLRNNLGNRLILRQGDVGSSKVAMNEPGGEKLLGKGHIIAKIDSDDKIYGQVPFLNSDEAATLAETIGRAWSSRVVLENLMSPFTSDVEPA